MRRTIIQRYRECQLASMCQYAGLSQKKYEELSDRIKEVFGKSWAEANRFQVYDFVCKELKLPPLLFRLGVNIHASSSTYDTEYYTFAELDLAGRGHILVVWTEYGGHSMSFEEGRVFDPNFKGSYTWKEWYDGIRTQYPLPEVKKVVVTK